MHALRTLGFDAVAEAVAERCDTPLGQEAARGVQPSFDEDTVWFELGRTDEAIRQLGVKSVRFVGVHDERKAVRRAAKGSVLDGETLAKIGRTLEAMRRVRTEVTPRREELRLLWPLIEALPEVPSLESALIEGLESDGYVRDEASVELANLRGRIASAERRAAERIQTYVSGKQRDLLSDAVVTQRDGRYVIPLKAENKGKIRGIVHDTSASGQTVYVEPEDVVALGNKLREAQAAERAEAERVLAAFSSRVGEIAQEFAHGVEAAADLDRIFGRARYGLDEAGVIPKRGTGAFISIVEGRHPEIPDEQAVRLSLDLGREHDTILITGPNTGGKTISIKTVGLYVAMAQSGIPVPAQEVKLGCFTQIWADIGDEQSLEQSLSTFSGHVKNIARALENLESGALVLLDEVGAGTDPGEGAALARALLLAFQRGGAKTMASTHYGELKMLASDHEGFVNASMEFDQRSLRPTYRLTVGIPGSSQAFKIAKRYGIPTEVIQEAELGIDASAMDVAKMIADLETSQRQARKAQSEADRLAARLRQVEGDLEERLSAAKLSKSKAREEAADTLERALREVRLEAEEIFDQLKKDASQKGMDRARARLKELQSAGGELAEEFRPAKPRRKRDAIEVKKGDAVKVRSLGGQMGAVLSDPRDGRVEVRVGPLKTFVNVADLDMANAPLTPARKRNLSSSQQLSRATNVSREVNLRQLRAEEAQEQLDRFLDEALLAGMETVRIVHGKGGGVLRKITHEVLRRHPQVRGFHEADAHEGGQGATVAVLA